MKKVCVYGSLRKGEYNFSRFKEYYPNEINVLSTHTILGYDLFDLGAYPGVKLSENKNQPLIIDILECGEQCFQHIEDMELGSGYMSHNINIDGQDCVIYIYKGYTSKKVNDGDWSKYIESKRQKQYV